MRGKTNKPRFILFLNVLCSFLCLFCSVQRESPGLPAFSPAGIWTTIREKLNHLKIASLKGLSNIMLRTLRTATLVLIVVAFCFFMKMTIYQNLNTSKFPVLRLTVTPNDEVNPKVILNKGNGIIFVETSDRTEPSTLVLCAIESAARVYPDRPVIFFMKGLSEVITEEEEKTIKNSFPSLSNFNNVYFLPLRIEELLTDTPLLSWYQKANPTKEPYWIHVLSDACRIALVWRYGGIYMDTDIISIRPILTNDFVVAQSDREFSNGVFGLSSQHAIAWVFMENFIKNYRGDIWGHQGPGLVTRVLNKICAYTKIDLLQDVKCGALSFFHPERFYPISYQMWGRYFQVWDNLLTFNKSFGLHLWNYMNKVQKTMVPGSNTLVEYLYKNNCPYVFEAELKKQKKKKGNLKTEKKEENE